MLYDILSSPAYSQDDSAGDRSDESESSNTTNDGNYKVLMILNKADLVANRTILLENNASESVAENPLGIFMGRVDFLQS